MSSFIKLEVKAKMIMYLRKSKMDLEEI